MNIHLNIHAGAFQQFLAEQEHIHLAKNLIDTDTDEDFDALQDMLNEGLVRGTSPIGEGGENLLMYAVRQCACSPFTVMAHRLAAEEPHALNHQNWDGNSVWHLMALHVDDHNFFSSGSTWFYELDALLEDHPELQIDWTLQNLQGRTPWEVAQDENKPHLANWMTDHMLNHGAQATNTLNG